MSDTPPDQSRRAAISPFDQVGDLDREVDIPAPGYLNHVPKAIDPFDRPDVRQALMIEIGDVDERLRPPISPVASAETIARITSAEVPEAAS